MKYVIEIEDVPFGRNDDPVIPHGMDELYRAKGFKSLVFDQNGLDKLTPYTEPDRKAIEDAQEEAWEFAGRLYYLEEYGGMNNRDFRSAFYGESAESVALNMSYQEAKSKYEAWKKQKEAIRVGDEVKPMDTEYDTMIVTRTWKDDYWSDCVDTIGFDGSICSFLTSNVKKTGRHFDDIAELLKKIKEK